MSSMRDGEVLTVGHSNHSIEHFLGLLAGANIEVLADVRSSPYSRYAPQFNLRELRHSLTEAKLGYVPMGDDLGGRPTAREFYDQDGHVNYERLAGSAGFLAGMERLMEGAVRYRVVVMCGEEDPMDCHRRLLVGRVVERHGFRVLHLRGDGAVEEESMVAARELIEHPSRHSPSLFGSKEEEWRSIRSVSGSTVPPTSSVP
jgi:uncharacterized protein (DUF488 family)